MLIYIYVQPMAASRMHSGSGFSFSAIVVLFLLWAEQSETQTVGTDACVCNLITCFYVHAWMHTCGLGSKLFKDYSLNSWIPHIMFLNVCVYTCIFIHTYISCNICMHVYLCMCVYYVWYICMYVYMWTLQNSFNRCCESMYVCMYVCRVLLITYRVRVYVYIHIYIYIYIYIGSFRTDQRAIRDCGSKIEIKAVKPRGRIQKGPKDCQWS
jgi:hypothetical protein